MSLRTRCLLPALLALAAATALAGGGAPPTHVHVRIHLADEAQAGDLLGQGWDVFGIDPFQRTAELAIPPDDLGTLQQMGLAPEVLDVGKPLPQALLERYGGDAVPAGYRDLAGLYQVMQSLATTYPALCQVVNLTATLGMPTTVEGRSLYALKISDNVAVDEDEPTAFIVACHHAREITTPEAALDAASYLLANASGATQQYVQGSEIWIVPVANPDGYEEVYYVDNWWRKNKRETCTTYGDGVDTNRNYPKDYSACGGSTSPCSETYRGPSAASEIETQTIMALNQRERFAVSIDYHSYGRDVLWGYVGSGACPQINATLQPPVVDTRNALMSALGFAQRAPSAGGEHYEWQYNAIGTHAYLLEINSNAQGFQPPYSEVPGIVTALRPGLHVILDRIEGPQIRGHVTSVGGAPLAADLAIQGIYLTGGELRQSSGTDGRFQWMLSPGTYQLHVGKSGYRSKTVVVEVGSGPAQIDVVLEPAVLARPRGPLDPASRRDP